MVTDHLLRDASMVKKVLGPWKDSYRPEISPDEFIQIHVESMENGTGLVFFLNYFFTAKKLWFISNVAYHMNHM